MNVQLIEDNRSQIGGNLTPNITGGEVSELFSLFTLLCIFRRRCILYCV